MQILQVKTAADFNQSQVPTGKLLLWVEMADGSATIHCKDENGNIKTISSSAIQDVVLLIPSDFDDDALHLELQLSANTDFSALVENLNTATSQAHITVFNGSVFGAFPSEGVGTPYYGSVISIDLQNTIPGYKYYGRYRWNDGFAPTDWQGFVFPAQTLT